MWDSPLTPEQLSVGTKLNLVYLIISYYLPFPHLNEPDQLLFYGLRRSAFIFLCNANSTPHVCIPCVTVKSTLVPKKTLESYEFNEISDPWEQAEFTQPKLCKIHHHLYIYYLFHGSRRDFKTFPYSLLAYIESCMILNAAKKYLCYTSIFKSPHEGKSKNSIKTPLEEANWNNVMTAWHKKTNK